MSDDRGKFQRRRQNPGLWNVQQLRVCIDFTWELIRTSTIDQRRA
jgi:hypothetical protein